MHTYILDTKAVPRPLLFAEWNQLQVAIHSGALQMQWLHSIVYKHLHAFAAPELPKSKARTCFFT
jgi:hypothetical protein